MGNNEINVKRVTAKIEKDVEVFGLRMLFVIDACQSKINDLSPGATIGEDGERCAVRLQASIAAAHYLELARKELEKISATY